MSPLLDLVMRLLGGQRDEPGHQRQPVRADEWVPPAALVALRGARVLLVEDNDLNQLIATELLEDAGFVVSVAAGVTIATMESIVLNPVVRAMPNTPAVVGKGVTGVSGGSRTTDADVALVTALFETVGDVLVIPESKIDALSTISGSGPAYVFYLIEELTKTARGLGFTDDQARVMVNGTFRGSADLLVSSGETPQELRRRVTSPKGTTERAVAELEKAHLSELFDRATAAALARAKEIAAG